MKLSTSDIWEEFHSDLYFFILKRVKNSDVTNEILQNSFLKIHKNLETLKKASKVKPWVFQITRNEIANFYKESPGKGIELQVDAVDTASLCCFDRFVDELPKSYQDVVIPVYFQGRKQLEVADGLGISLANVKARLRRAKALLKERFQSCCNYQINKKGLLTGEPECLNCTAI
ncbi:MAG: sigma-70 family RNA polymerase sigma factor [Bacteroidota bacterium]